MLLTVTRTLKTTDGIFGNLVIDSNAFKCVTMENLAMAIPAGIYDVLFMWSEHFSQIMPHIVVPARSAIEIHWANAPSQLQGCLALGNEAELGQDYIAQSRNAWIGFVKAITDQPSIKIKYVEDYGT